MGRKAYPLQFLRGSLLYAGRYSAVLACEGQRYCNTGCHQMDEGIGSGSYEILTQPFYRRGDLAGGGIDPKEGR